MSQCCIVIPARLQSSRLPGKVLLPLAGQSMLERVWRIALAAVQSDAMIQAACIATADEPIATAAQQWGATVLRTGEHPSGTDRIAEAVTQLELSADNVVINLQADEPLMPVAIIAQLAAFAVAQTAAVSSIYRTTTDRTLIDNPNRVKVVCDQHNQALYFSRSVIPAERSQRDTEYRIHYGLYAYRVSLLQRWSGWQAGRLETAEGLEQLRLLEQGEGIAMLEAAKSIPEGVDTPQDLQRVVALLGKE